MTRDEVGAFIDEIRRVYPNYYYEGAPETVTESWKDVLRYARPNDALRALQSYFSSAEPKGYPMPGQIAKLLRDGVDDVDKMPYDPECPYCNCGVITYFYLGPFGRCERMLTCVCAAERRGDSPGNIAYLGRRRDDIAEAGNLKYSFRKNARKQSDDQR